MKIPTDKQIYETAKRNPNLAALMLQDKKKANQAQKEQPKKSEIKIPTDNEIYEMSKRNPRLAARMLQQQKRLKAEEGKNGPPKNENPPQAEMKKAVKNTLATNLVIIGSIKIIRGTENFAKWSSVMLAENGEGIKPHLTELYNASKHVAALDHDNEKDFIESAKMAATGIHICATELSSKSDVTGRKHKARKMLERRSPKTANYLKVMEARRASKEHQNEKLPTDKEIREMADKNPTVAAAMLRQRKRINNR